MAAEDNRNFFEQRRGELLADVVRVEGQRQQELVHALVSLANLYTQRATFLRRHHLSERPTRAAEEEAVVQEINQLYMEASELHARAMRVDPLAARSMAITSCVWQAPPDAALSFRTIEDSPVEKEHHQQSNEVKDENEKDENEDEDEDEDELSDDIQERHMFDLACSQYEAHLHRSAEQRIVMRYAHLLVNRLQEKGGNHTEEEQEQFTARAAELLKQLLHNSDEGIRTDAEEHLHRLDGLTKNKRLRKTQCQEAKESEMEQDLRSC